MVLRIIVLFGLGLMGVNYTVAAPICSANMHSDDRIRYDKQTLTVSKACKEFTVNLVHSGQLTKEVMGHNWVLTKAKDKEVVVKMLAFEKQKSYVLDDARIIAHSQLIGGGERTSVVLDVSQLEKDQQYVYFCSYPEHATLMEGQVVVVD